MRKRRWLWFLIAASLARPALAGEAPALPDLRQTPLLLHSRADAIEPVQDWLRPADPRQMLPYPENGALVAQNPPVLRWPYDPAVASWQVRLRGEDGTVLERHGAHNWLLLDAPLNPGRYEWQVRGWPHGGASGPWSTPRHFSLLRGAFPFLVPSARRLYDLAGNRARPRSLPAGDAGAALRKALLDGARQSQFQAFAAAHKERYLGQPAEPEPGLATDGLAAGAEQYDASRAISRASYAETTAVAALSRIWQVSGEPEILAEALRRIRNLAAWDPNGSTGAQSHDIMSRLIMSNLALALDLTWEHWSEAERRQIAEVIVARGQALFDRYIAAGPLSRYPYNSHGSRHAAALIETAVLLAGLHPRAEQWLAAVWPVYVAVDVPWGSDDGGFANGLAYATWNMEAELRVRDTVRNATGIDLMRTAWARQAGWYFLYLAPPQSPGAVFGDGSERDMRVFWERLAHTYAQRSPLPEMRAYARLWSAEAPVHADWLFAPLAEQQETPANDLAHLPAAAVFPSIGWAALHSTLADTTRTSIYFQSSPYGSYNHSHAAQNSFVIHSRGRVLALASGYYDFYASPHHNGWSRTTRAQNAITFDGGQGQPIDDKGAQGRIRGFRHTPELDFVIGDASAAYAGALTLAQRTLVYLRSFDVVLVRDQLQSPQPRIWEWNLHSPSPVVTYAAGAFGLANEKAQLCVQKLAGPDTELLVFDRFAVPPNRRFGEMPEQWHATFRSRAASTSADFLFLLRINCGEHSARLLDGSGPSGLRLAIGERQLEIDESGARWLDE